MTCKTCGIEIAQNALICYRCGAPTVEAERRPPGTRTRRGVVEPLVLATLAALAVYAGPVGLHELPDAASYGATAICLLGLVRWAVRAG